MFLAELHPAADASAREAVLRALRRRDHDATHHCSAWRAGVPAAGWGADDDGEPAGTAGRPMLRVLAGAELTDCLAVCIRWFGGTKLGTGGLVRAYTEALQGAVAQAEADGLLEEVRELRRGRIQVPAAAAHLPYARFGAFPRVQVLESGASGDAASVRFSCPPEDAPGLERAWQERSRGGRIDWEEG